MKQIRQLLLAVFCVMYVLGVNGSVSAQNENPTNSTETRDANAITPKASSITAYTVPFTELIPASVTHHHAGPVIRAVFDKDTRPVRLLLDTAASLSVIKESFAKTRKLPIRPAKEINHRKEELGISEAWGAIEDRQFVVVESVNFDVLELDSTPFIVVADAELPDSIHNRAKETRNILDGVLGGQAFAGTAVRFDYSAKQVVFFERGKLIPQELADIGFTSMEVITLPLTFNGRFFTVQIQMGGREKELVVDTGANQTKIYASPEDLPDANKEKHRAFGSLGKVYSGVLVEKELSFQGRTIARTDVFVVEKGKLPQDGLLGADVLSRFDVLMDFPGGKLYLKPLKKEAKKP